VQLCVRPLLREMLRQRGALKVRHLHQEEEEEEE
jgi:hypothetical protein